jgi:hypothetical protein
MRRRRGIAVHLSLGLVSTCLVGSGCSSSPSSTNLGVAGDDGGASSPLDGGSSGGSSSVGSQGTASSSAVPGSSSSGGAGGNASAGGAGSSGGAPGATPDAGPDAGPSSGIPQRVTGCGQGTSCTPGTDLAPPASGQGYQIATPANAIAVQPGAEEFLCYYRTLPNTSTINVGSYQSYMTAGSSHHFIAYQVGSGSAGAFGSEPDGTLVSCAFGGGTWMYATSLPGEIIEMKMPDGVGLPLPAGTQVMLNMHFINPGSSTAYPQVKLNLNTVADITYKAAAMYSFNTSIDVPAATSSGPGTQTVSGTCTAPVGSNFFVMTSHTHKFATVTKVNYLHGGQTYDIVDTTDWEHPDVGVWQAPNFLTVQAGDSFTYSCSYSNPTSMPVLVGDTAATNEMCMAIGYYFPAGNASCM